MNAAEVLSRVLRRYQALIFFEITSILRHMREVFGVARINRISGECPIAPLADYVKTQKNYGDEGWQR